MTFDKYFIKRTYNKIRCSIKKGYFKKNTSDGLSMFFYK